MLTFYLSALVIYELTRHVQDDVAWCMLLVDIVLIDETRKWVSKLEAWG